MNEATFEFPTPPGPSSLGRYVCPDGQARWIRVNVARNVVNNVQRQ